MYGKMVPTLKAATLAQLALRLSVYIGSEQTTWTMLHRYRTTMVKPRRERFSGRIQKTSAALEVRGNSLHNPQLNWGCGVRYIATKNAYGWSYSHEGGRPNGVQIRWINFQGPLTGAGQAVSSAENACLSWQIGAKLS